MPKVLNKRTDKVPADAIYVGRPSKWGNPYRVQAGMQGNLKYAAHRTAVRLYQEYLQEHPDIVKAAKKELRGKDLVCWCSPLPCHADILLELANQEVK